MNLFRSEENARNWSEFAAGTEDNIKPLSAWMERFSQTRFKMRGAPDYISRRAAGEF